WLENTLVIIDPCLNPDGYSRYTHWYRNVAPKNADPSPWVREHLEPWPGGRVNHYHFDLNRDWAWKTQKESQLRSERYLDWLPHIHADVHEQGYNSPYYFAPAAKPFHEYITDWQGEYQTEIGKNHTKYFDSNGWLYFTRERFDLLYPSYGDTYPTFHGSIGMTYEQAGHSRAGRAILTETGDTLTLDDRVTHHATTSLSTVEVASRDADRIVKNFGEYFQQADNPPGKYKTFVIKPGDAPKRLAALTKLLDKNRIEYGYATNNQGGRGYSYLTGKSEDFTLEKGDLVVSAHQPLGVFAQVLLEPQTMLEDSVTYDITAWSLPYAYGLPAFALTSKNSFSTSTNKPAVSGFKRPESLPYAYMAEWTSVADAAFLGDLLEAEVRVRYALEPIGVEGKEFASGTLVM
ncbi:MAG: zinc carboxypeptidase, partial [Bacteroidota bacterium]